MAAKNKNKTAATAADPMAFIDKVESDVKRSDSHELVAIMEAVTGEPPKDVGPDDRRLRHRHYKYESGREGDICLMGFSPRSSGLVLYIGPTLEDTKLMSKLGKHKTGKGCLYINKLDDVDRGVLRKIIEKSVALTRKTYPALRGKAR
jgi:predicted oxidoreductase